MHGSFPFGQPNLVRPPRVSSETRVLVVGVYPSAMHVRWWRPDALSGRPTISALAVDVEPVVFWDGESPSPQDLLTAWKKSVGFNDGWGRVEPGLNGPSGRVLETHYLEPLGATPSNTSYTDLIPWFFVKSGAGSQGAAITERFKPWAAGHGAPPSSLPSRPTPQELVGLLEPSGRRESLRNEIISINPDTILTLGQEALDGLEAASDECRPAQERLAPDERYGRTGSVTVANHQFELMATVHPGLLRQTRRADWRSAHQTWADRQRHVH
jgi:uracil-DNA glycosylase